MSAPAAGAHQADESGQGERSDGSNQKPRNASGSQESGQWRLLHPLVLVEDAIDGVKSSVSLIIAAAVVIFHFNPPHWVIWAFGAFVVVCACLIAPLVGYFSTRYRMTGESVEYRSGIVVRKHNIIAYSHIHAISSDEPFYYKPTGVRVWQRRRRLWCRRQYARSRMRTGPTGRSAVFPQGLNCGRAWPIPAVVRPDSGE